MGLTKPRAYQIYDIDYKQAVRVVTTSNITLSGGAPNSVDGVTLSLNDRVLVTGQTTGSQNGIYYVTTLGTGSNGTWARSVDGNETGEILAGMIIMVTEGTTYADTQWKLTTNDPIVIGTTSLTFVLAVQANLISSGSSNVVVNSNANVTVSSAGTANVLVVSSTGTVTTGTASVTANITGGNVLTGGLVSATGNITGGNILTSGLISATGNITVGNITTTIANVTTFTSAQGGNVTGTLIATSANAQFFNQTNGAGYVTVAGYLSAVGNVTSAANITGGNVLTGGLISSTGNIITGANLITTANAIIGTDLFVGSGANTTSFTNPVIVGRDTGVTYIQAALVNTSGNGSADWTAYANNGTESAGWVDMGFTGNTFNDTAYTVTAPNDGYLFAQGNASFGGNLVIATGNTGTTKDIVFATGGFLTGNIKARLVNSTGAFSVTANIIGGNLTTGGQVSATANITGGNILTGGLVSATSTITSSANITGGNILTAGLISATGNITGGNITTAGKGNIGEIFVTTAAGDEGGQINMALAVTNTTLSGSVVIDVYQNKLRFYEGGGTARGAYIDLTSAAAGVGTNLLAGGGGGGTPGGSNTYVQFNDAGAFGGNAQFTYDKVTNTLTAGIIASTNNGAGTNFKVGDDAWIGDINTADTMSIRGQQNAANGYIVFGNADATGKLGRAGTGPLTYAGAFSATANITGGNILTGGLISATSTITGTSFIGAVASGTTVSATGNITGGNILTGGLISAASTVTGTSFIGAVASSTTVSATGNITGGNILTGGLISATGNINGGNIIASGATIGTAAASFTGRVVVQSTGSDKITIAGATSRASWGTAGGAFVIQAGTMTDTSTLAGTLAAQAAHGIAQPTLAFSNIVTVTNASTLYIANAPAAGTNATLTNSYALYVAAGKSAFGGDIINVQANGVGNIGSSTGYFNTVFAKATSAQYADLAEMYISDANYAPGTVVEFGGLYEVTQTTTSCSTAVAGIISTNPSYLMNSCQEGEYVLPVALTGRVPCQVQGPVKKGDVLVSSNIPGVAQRIGSNWQPGCTVGKAMESIADAEVKVIEVAVGRL